MPTVVELAKVLTTNKGGPNQRIRVDPGQTGFFTGQMFRTYIEYTIPSATSISLRFTSPIDFILWHQSLDCDQGGVRLEVFTGSTPSGTWTALPSIGVNRMSERPTPLYTNQCTVETGGTFTGGTAVDLLRVRAASQNVSATNVGVAQDTERGLPAGTYYIRLSALTGVNGDSLGIYRIAWEERSG